MQMHVYELICLIRRPTARCSVTRYLAPKQSASMMLLSVTRPGPRYTVVSRVPDTMCFHWPSGGQDIGAQLTPEKELEN